MAAAALIPILIACFGRSFFTINDDGVVLALLRSGEARTFVLSYPLSRLLVLLYQFAPRFPWYSELVLAMLSVATATMAYAVVTNRHADWLQKGLMVSSILCFSVSCSNKINFTAAVTLLFVAAYQLAFSADSRAKRTLLVLIIPLVIVGRGDTLLILMVFAFLPLLAVAGSTRQRIFRLLLLTASAVAVWSLAQLPLDPDYQRFKRFNAARSIYSDLQYPMRMAGVDAEDAKLFRDWFFYDEKVFPTGQLVESAPGLSSILSYRIFEVGQERLREALTLHAGELLLIVLSLAYVGCRDRRFSLGALLGTGQLAICLGLFMVRDVERLSQGVLFLTMSTIHLLPAGKLPPKAPATKVRIRRSPEGYRVVLSALRPGLFFLCLAILCLQLAKVQQVGREWGGRFSVPRGHQARSIKEGVAKTAELAGTLLLPDLMRPNRWYDTFRLAHEEVLLGYAADGWLPAGWMARSPIYYQTLQRQGLTNFGDLVLREKVAIVYSLKDNQESRARYARFLSKSYAAPGFAYLPVTVYRDETVEIDKFRLTPLKNRPTSAAVAAKGGA